MEYIAGFYVVLGFLIIIFKSEFLRKYVYKPFTTAFQTLSHSTKAVRVKPANSYGKVDKLTLQKVPVKAFYKE